jgi:hypothetical protein
LAALNAVEKGLGERETAVQVIRATLSHHFGDKVLDDPKFAELIDGIMQHFDEAPSLMKEVRHLMSQSGAG